MSRNFIVLMLYYLSFYKEKTVFGYELVDSDQFSAEEIKTSNKNITPLVEDDINNFRSLNDCFWLVTFNASGVTLDSYKILDASNTYNLLESLSTEIDYKRFENTKESLSSSVLLQLVQILPENSTVIIFIKPNNNWDNDITTLSSRIIFQKNITIFAMIKEKQSSGNDFLENISALLSGKVLKEINSSNGDDDNTPYRIMKISEISKKDMNNEIVLGNLSFKFNNNKEKYVIDNEDKLPDTIPKSNNGEFMHKQHSYLPKGHNSKDNIINSIFGKKNDFYPIQTLTVEVGLGSELITSPGKNAEVYFEVTNKANNVQYVSFTCSDQKYILHNLSAYKRTLDPQESTTIVLYLKTYYGTYQDEIIFSAKSGSQLTQKKILVDVGSHILDQNLPELNYKYTSDCTNVIFSKCEKGTWSIEITAKDADSGLLQLNTSPQDIFFTSGYIAGTTDTVTGYVSDSCCNPDLQIFAVDRMNNQRTYSVNAYRTIWSPGAIAALVLGILLFLIIVGLIIYFIIKKRKQKESYNLPRYRGGGGGI